MTNTKYLTKDLIATNGVYISPSFYPKGFTVAKHDAEGFTSDMRWFETMEKATAYAYKLNG